MTNIEKIEIIIESLDQIHNDGFSLLNMEKATNLLMCLVIQSKALVEENKAIKEEGREKAYLQVAA